MICFLGDDFSVIGGVETTTFNLQEKIYEEYGLKCDIFSVKNTQKCDKKFKIIPFEHRIKYLTIIRSFIYLYSLGYRQIVTSYFAYNIINALMSRILGYRSIIQEHASAASYSWAKRIFITLFYRLANQFVVLNEFDRDFYEKRRLNPKIFMNCYNYVRNSLPVSQKEYYLILGRMDENKRVHLAIEAYLNYLSRGGKHSLIIVGDGPTLYELKKNHFNKKIKFIGAVREPLQYILNARALIMTSRFECYPTVVIEGKYVGTPAIAFNVPSGLPDIISSNEDGHLIKNDDCEIFSDTLLKYDDNEFLSSISMAAYKSSYRFDSVVSARQYYDLFTLKA